jgi:hypothetical protein
MLNYVKLKNINVPAGVYDYTMRTYVHPEKRSIKPRRVIHDIAQTKVLIKGKLTDAVKPLGTYLKKIPQKIVVTQNSKIPGSTPHAKCNLMDRCS